MRISLNTLIVLLFVIVIAMGYGLSVLSSRHSQSAAEVVISEAPEQSMQPHVDEPTSGWIQYADDDSIPEEERAQIEARFVAPLRDYSSWIATGTPVRSVLVRVGDPEQGGQYLATVSFEDGRIEDLTIAKDARGIRWWQPVCAQDCVYPDSFVQKYPEVVSPVEE